MTEAAFETLCDRTDLRIEALVPYLIESQTSSVKLRLALNTGWKTFIRSRLIEFVHRTILSDLVRRGQIEGWAIDQDIVDLAQSRHGSREDIQSILAELINPSFDFRTVPSIAKATHLREDFVEAMLVALERPSTPDRLRVWKDGGAYTFFQKRPGFFGRRAIVKWFNRWWNSPAVD
jgi:hypothetical protein